MWVIATKNLCTFLCKYKDDNKLSSTSDINKAFGFPSKLEAEKYISNQMAKSVRNKYVVVKSQTILKNEANSDDFKWLNLHADASLSSFKQVSEILKRIPSYKKLLEAKRQEVEDAILDIYHYIEFTNVGTVQAYKIYKKAQELLQLRRKIKEEQFCVDQLNKCVSSTNVRLDEYINALDKMQDRTYIPRVLVELFHTEDNQSNEG